MKLQPVRGTHDLLPDDFRAHAAVVDIARRVTACYGYQEIAVPVFEFSEIFHRTLGETSDVVSKETYTFIDRGGESLTLRPEFTAGIARAYISEGLKDQVPLKWFTTGPLFRYERPQKGRLRQFHQIDAELIGVEGPQGDIEVIAMAAQVLSALGLADKVTLEINTLGDTESRDSYRAALVDYFMAHKDKLSEDSATRLERNPLRILDSKDAGDRALVVNAPGFGDYLTPMAADFFRTVCQGLSDLGIDHTCNPRLVRGLDYYTHTAFEFTTTALGAQGTVLAGGRYDHLVTHMGGPQTPGIGWAAGVERLAELAAIQTLAPRPIAIIPRDAVSEAGAAKLAYKLRGEGFTIELGYKGDAGKRMKRANKVDARAAVFVGSEDGLLMVRDLDSGVQEATSDDMLMKVLEQYKR